MTVDELLKRAGGVQLATLIKEPPARASAYVYELKFDGYRIVAAKAGRSVRLVSRRGQDWTGDFQPIADAVKRVAASTSVLDGEVCALDERNRPSFQRLQNRGDPSTRLVYFVFDLLWLGRDDLRRLPLEQRRKRLEDLLGAGSTQGRIVVSPASEGDPVHMLRAACADGYEGLIAKEKGAPYTAGRTTSWLKIKCTLRQEFAVVGYLPLLGTRRGEVGSLLLALMEKDGRLHFAGKVGTGFDAATRRSLGEQLEADHVPEPPVVGAPRLGHVERWARPKLVAEVAFTEWTEGGHVRHPSFQGLRKDKKPEECVREEPRKPPTRRG